MIQMWIILSVNGVYIQEDNKDLLWNFDQSGYLVRNSRISGLLVPVEYTWHSLAKTKLKTAWTEYPQRSSTFSYPSVSDNTVGS